MEREFPILGENSGIPWNAIESHRTQAYKNHNQTIERLAERGGLSWGELLAVLEDRSWRPMTEAAAKFRVLQMVVKELDCYRKEALGIAADLLYSDTIIHKIMHAKSVTEISNAMAQGRMNNSQS